MIEHILQAAFILIYDFLGMCQYGKIYATNLSRASGNYQPSTHETMQRFSQSSQLRWKIWGSVSRLWRLFFVRMLKCKKLKNTEIIIWKITKLGTQLDQLLCSLLREWYNSINYGMNELIKIDQFILGVWSITYFQRVSSGNYLVSYHRLLAITYLSV